jgi:SAM-dependent methyltransferase
VHRAEEYDERSFEILVRMQRRHFWYLGRHRLLLRVLQREVPRHLDESTELRAVDLGGGCGGWLEYLHVHGNGMFEELALADSSMQALSLAEGVVGSFATRYQIDLLELPWNAEWDVAFLLDVLEHIPDHADVLRQAAKALRPGGLLFVTAPALDFFWSDNDEAARHQRRYCREDFRILVDRTGLELLRADYFMFFLSPALLLSRISLRSRGSPPSEQRRERLRRLHRIPARPVNAILAKIFSIEASLVNAVRFPWGTSILAVFRRRRGETGCS